MEYYISEGDSGRTFGVHYDGETLIQIQFPNGELGNISKLEQYDNWNLPRWKGQMDLRGVSREDLPEQLVEQAENQLK